MPVIGPDRMTVVMPVAVHRLWCSELVAVPGPTGWPTIDGVSVFADHFRRPPADWRAGQPAREPLEDLVVVRARNLYRPVLKRYCIGPGREDLEPICRQLRIDGWSTSDALEAATLQIVSCPQSYLVAGRTRQAASEGRSDRPRP